MRNSTSWIMAFALLSGAAVLPPMQAAAVELNEALSKTYEYNPRLRSQREQLEQANEQVSEAISGWRPSVSADYSRGREKFEYQGRTANYDNMESRSLTASQPIFNGGGTIARTRSANENVKSEREQLRATEQDILNSAVVAFMDVVTNQALLELASNNEKVLTEQLDATQERLDVGEVTITDKAQSEARLSAARSDRIEAEGNLVTAKSTYRNVVGEEPQGLVMPKKLPEIPKNLDEAIEIALSNNPNLKSAEYLEQAAKSDVWVRKADILPTVSLNGDVRRDDGGASFGAAALNREDVTLNVRVPLYQSGAEYARVREAKNRAQERKHNVKTARDEIVRRVTTAWEQLQTTRATLKSRQDNINAAKVALDGVKQELLYGSRTTLDVLDAEQELFSSRVEFTRSQRNEVVALFNLLGAIGRGAAKDLSLDVAMYDPEKHYNKVKYRMIGF